MLFRGSFSALFGRTFVRLLSDYCRTFVRPLSDFFLFPAPAAGAGFHDLHACCRAGSLPGILLRCPDGFLACCPCGSSPRAAALVLLLLPDLSPWTAARWRLSALCPLLPSLVGSPPCFACYCPACCPGGAPPAALLPLWASFRMDSPPGRLVGRLGSLVWPFSGCAACCRICLRFRAGSCCPIRSSPAATLPGIFSGWMERPLRPPRWMARRSLSDLLHGLRLRASARDPPDGLQLVPVLPCAIV